LKALFKNHDGYIKLRARFLKTFIFQFVKVVFMGRLVIDVQERRFFGV